MASEDVCIILNERESAKEKAAETLLTRLEQNNITASRLKADPKIDQIVLKRSPKLVILDYVIGDFTTGLDLVQELNEKELDCEFIFLTDEPSVPVAVDAMRLGAANYFELTNPEAINLIVNETKEILKAKKTRTPKHSPKDIFKLKHFIAQSKLSSKVLDEATKQAYKKSALTLICGPSGSGKSCLAEGIFSTRDSSSYLRSCNWDLFGGKIENLFGIKKSSGLSIGNNLSLIIDHVTLEDQELLSFCSEQLDQNWIRNEQSNNQSYLTVCTAEKECAQAWSKIFDVNPIFIPALNLRKEDIPALTRHIISEIANLYSIKAKTLEASVLKGLSQLDWPGNVKQLRGVVFDAAISTIASGRSWNEAFEESYERSIELLGNLTVPPPTPLTVATVIERCNGNLRASAATLGISIAQIKTILKENNAFSFEGGLK